MELRLQRSLAQAYLRAGKVSKKRVRIAAKKGLRKTESEQLGAIAIFGFARRRSQSDLLWESPD
ncbi:MAG: hypothetical protein DMG48_12660 [Acidobacteria bacterium]|nr:MAG: hypothetical protein DMG48_12660 [Acidobacteriota bacterium]